MKMFEDCRAEMTQMLQEIQMILWQEDDGTRVVWNPDKSWSPDTLDEIADVMSEFRPAEEAPL